LIASANMKNDALFKDKACKTVRALMERFNLKDFQAAGAVGNLGHESAGFTFLHEIGQPPGRGGYGWGQWTGPRRHSFLWWCETHHLDWRSDDANLTFLIHELEGAYRDAAQALAHCDSLDAATKAFEEKYERAGVPALPSRVRWAHQALDAYRDSRARALASAT
jgi:hypothetical protein